MATSKLSSVSSTELLPFVLRTKGLVFPAHFSGRNSGVLAFPLSIGSTPISNIYDWRVQIGFKGRIFATSSIDDGVPEKMR